MPDDRSRSESDASGTLAATICPYVKKENPPAEGTFEIGIVLAGAISAGAYSSGVVDFLIEALDAWEAAKEAERKTGRPQNEWSVPPHDVVLRVFAGASAVPARIVWTRVCNSGGLFHGGCVTGFMG
ncbi:hypothetical protein AWB68_07588 [Caballeronia choica]|uniref:Uncharacterized protein n=1 Tax=Caballeronia choica TaxID=326476 RepID=A0A158KX38_9BURK|nr:hypothetical protein [Caballeronia choica]SAL85170.1 hypothetical protein AWB68_07588 [Caballeronia choica]